MKSQRCEHKDSKIERCPSFTGDVHGKKYKRVRRCPKMATAKWQTKPDYYPVQTMLHLCDDHGLARNDGWERAE